MINSNNYVVQLISIKKVLLANSYLLIYTREELKLSTNTIAAVKQSYKTRKTTTFKILNTSILKTYYDTISTIAEQ